jgi:hypothetical protein
VPRGDHRGNSILVRNYPDCFSNWPAARLAQYNKKRSAKIFAAESIRLPNQSKEEQWPTESYSNKHTVNSTGSLKKKSYLYRQLTSQLWMSMVASKGTKLVTVLVLIIHNQTCNTWG